TTVTHKFGNYGEKNSWTVNSANIGKQGFHGSTKTDTLNVTGSTKATIDLNKTSLYTSINNVSASKATAAMTIKGTSGSNYLIGGKGNDVLSGGKGNDTLKGGAGDDKISVSSTGTNRLYGGIGDDTITTSASATDKIYFNAGDGKDIIINSDNKDILYLNNITDIRSEAIFGMSGQDLVMNFTVNKDTDAITITNWSTGGMNKFVVGGSTYSLQQSGNKVSVK
ncbi:Hemolysin-type calcium-binding repeat-containing protein, partial [Selenomonas sp. KH1T6]